MQNRYVGDVGDFGKYGLLRFLSGQVESHSPCERLRLGVVWYLHPDETHNSDGRHTGYLSTSSKGYLALRDCDPILHDALSQLVRGNTRDVSRIRDCGILPEDTTYYEKSLQYTRSASRSSRIAVRQNWLDGALEATQEADLVFVDPDNGITENVDPFRKNGPKYVYLDDLRLFKDRDQSLVVYHHLGRRGTAVEQIMRVANTLQAKLNLPQHPLSLRFRRGSARAYFVVSQPQHDATLQHRITDLLHTGWASHFELVR